MKKEQVTTKEHLMVFKLKFLTLIMM